MKRKNRKKGEGEQGRNNSPNRCEFEPFVLACAPHRGPAAFVHSLLPPPVLVLLLETLDQRIALLVCDGGGDGLADEQ